MARLLQACAWLVAAALLCVPAAAEMELLVGSASGQVHRFGIADKAYRGTLLSIGSPAYGIAVGQDNDVYVSSPDTNEVIHWDRATGAVDRVDVSAHVTGPHGLAVGLGSNNYLYIAGAATGEILKYDPALNYVGVFASGISGPSGLEFCSNGNLYVAEMGTPGPTADAGIRKYTSGGVLVLTFSAGSELNDPWGLASYNDPAFRVYLYAVSRETNNVVRYIRNTGVYDATWSLRTADGSSPFIGLAQPTGITVDSAGNLYVADTGNDRVLKFNGNTGAFVEVWANVPDPYYLEFADVPEPSGLIGLSAGAAGLIGFAIRRRSRHG